MIKLSAVAARCEKTDSRRSYESSYRAVFESAPVALFVCDRAGVIQSFNRVAADMWGREPRVGVEKHCGSLRLFLPDGSPLPHEDTPMQEVMRTGVAVRGVEVIIERPDFTRLPVLVSFAPIRDEDGAITGAITSFHDIAERKHSEEQLRESDARYQTLFASIDEGFCVMEMMFDENGRAIDFRFLEVNPAFEAESGLPAAVGKTINELVPELEDIWFQRYGAVARSGEPTRFEAFARDLARWFDVYAFRLGAAGSDRVAVLFKDITERKETEGRLRAATDDLNGEVLAMKRLHQFSTRLVGKNELQPLLLEVLDAAIALEEADYGIIQLRQAGSAELEIVAVRGLTANALAHFRVVEDNHSACMRALELRQHVMVENVETDPLYRALAWSTDYRAVHSTPLYSRSGQGLGVLTTLFCQAHRPSDRDIRLVDLYARVAADLIERKQAEDALRASEVFLQSIVGASADCLKVLGLDGRLQWMSVNGLCAMEVPDFEKIRGLEWLTVWRDAPTRQKALAALEAARAGGVGQFRGFCPTFGHTPKWWDVVISLIREPDGRPRALLGVSRDVTERVRAEEQLKLSEENLRRTLEELESRVETRTSELAASNVHLREEIAEREGSERARQRLLEQLVKAEEEERRRISRELHDQVGQQLTALLLDLKALQPNLAPAGGDTLRRLALTAQNISKEVHDLALELRPTALDDVGLAAALANYVAGWSDRTRVQAEFHQVGLEARLPAALESTVYRLVQEALTNVAKHARGRRVSVVVERRPHEVLVIVEDDGVGFDVEGVLQARSPQRLGLLGMKERASACGGTVNFESFPERGTAVYCHLPLSYGS